MEQPFTQPSDSINAIRPRYSTENSGGSRRETPSHINAGASRGASNSSPYNQSKQEFTRWRSHLVIVVATQATVPKMFDALQMVKHVEVATKLVILPRYVGIGQSQLTIHHHLKIRLSR
jgi:hypothetical protein